jgi:hypothetical protein
MPQSDRSSARLEDPDPTHCSRSYLEVERLVHSVNSQSMITQKVLAGETSGTSLLVVRRN